MKVLLAIFELLVGLASGFAGFILLASLAGISTPVWNVRFFLYWGGIFAGPLMVVIGAALTLAGTAEKAAAVLTMLGSAILTCWAIYLASSIPAERSRGALSAGLIVLVVGIVFVALASDIAAYKIYRLVGRVQSLTGPGGWRKD